MKEFDVLKDIWDGQTEQPKASYEDIVKRIRKTKNRFANKLLFQVITLVVAILLIAEVLLKQHFMLGTSQFALVIFIACCLYYLFMQIRDYRKINNSELLLEQPTEYIAYLKSYKQKRYIFNTRIYRIYMFFIALGLALFFVEIFLYSSLWLAIGAVIFTIIWFAVCYYIFMKLYIRKEEEKLEEMISSLERLQEQFNEL